MSEPVPVGVIGLGRSGYSIHCRTMLRLPERYRIAAVTDADPARRQAVATELGAVAHASVDALLADPRVELIVVSSPNALHAPHAIAALSAGKHVVCEKPFGLNVGEVDAMIAAAKAAGKIVAPFQNRRYEGSYQKVREILESGVLGRIVHIRMHMHGFGRRWDWQTIASRGGGQLNNNGPHALDHALGLYEALGFGDVEALDVWADLQTTLSTGDAEDHVRITLRAPDGGPTMDIELVATCPYPAEKWLVMATAGGLRGDTSRLEWKWVDWTEMPDRPPTEISTADRSYNREELPWQEASHACVEDADADFYRDLFRTLRENAPHVIPPESIRKRIRLMERIREAAKT